MAITQNDKNPMAYPVVGKNGEIFETGMTLRDYYAGIALQGLIMYPHWIEQSESHLTETAYLIADEMIKNRNP